MARTFVGLDIGHHMVRAVALRRDGRSFAIVGHAEISRIDEDGTPRPLRAVVKDLKKLVPLGASPTVSIGDLDTLVRYVGTMPLPPDRLQRLLRLELLQALEANELAADSFPVPLASEELIHCCILTHPTQAHEAIVDLAAVGVRDPILQASSAAVYNVTVPFPPVQDEELALLVDIGSARTSVVLFGDRRLLACRQLSIGGDTFTEALCSGTSSKEKRLAEQKKLVGEGSASPVEFSGRAAVGGKTSSDTGSGKFDKRNTEEDEKLDLTGGLQLDDSEDQLFSTATEQVTNTGVNSTSSVEDSLPAEPVPQLSERHNKFTLDTIEPVAVTAPGFATQQIATRQLGPELTKVAESLYGQLASSLAWFRTQIRARQLLVTKIFITGGGASLDGLEAYLQRRFNMPVKRFDPCDALTGKIPERPHVFATAIGLAISSANSIQGTVSLDLTPDSLQIKRLWRARLIWPYVAAACLIFATVLAGWTMLHNKEIAQLNIDSFNEYQKKYDELKGKLENLKTERDGLSEDLRAIAGRLYAGRDVLLNIRALKEQTEKSKELWITSLSTVDIASDSEVSDPANATRGLRPVRPPSNQPEKGKRRDTLIDRGAVDVKGLVKFDLNKADSERNKFFEDYYNALTEWKPKEDGVKLFRESRVIEHMQERKEDPKLSRTKLEEPGRFEFKIRLFFKATDLSAITTAKLEGDHKL